MHLGPSPWLGCCSTRCGNRLQFSVKKGHISKTSCNKWGYHKNSSPLFVHSMHSSFLCFIVIVIVKVMSQSSHLPWGLLKMILGGGHYSFLAHFRALHFTTSHFPCCQFSFIVDDIHIIGMYVFSIISYIYEHFQTELRVICFFIQAQKCVTWSCSGFPPNFNTPSQFTTTSKGIKVLKVPLGTLIFTSSFIKDVLQEDAWHVDLFFKIGDVQVAFGILTRCFVQPPLYLSWFPPS